MTAASGREATSIGMGHAPFPELLQKVVVLVTEDWFALSHFQPLIRVLKQIAREVVVVTRPSGRHEEIEALGARVVDFDYQRSSSNLLREVASVWRLARILEGERPDVVHLIAMKPIVLGSLAMRLVPGPRAMVHLTGLGFLGVSAGVVARLYRQGAMCVAGSVLRRPSSFLLVENPDDLATLRAKGADPGARFAILGGAGVDPEVFPALERPRNDTPVVAYVGRMIKSKGVDVLMRAYERLARRGARLTLELYGKSDEDNPEAVDAPTLDDWCARRGAKWFGHVADVREVWRHADIYVLPARGGEGLPRALLEAAACGRPLVVTDVPGCRHFVRDGVEGLIVPPGDADALADALHRLARDVDLRTRMGEAARLRVLQGFTEAHVTQSLRDAYAALRTRL